MTRKDLLDKARALLLEGNVAAANVLIDQAEAMKRLEDAGTTAPAPTEAKSQPDLAAQVAQLTQQMQALQARPAGNFLVQEPTGTTATETASATGETLLDLARKSSRGQPPAQVELAAKRWYTSKFGELDAAVEQVGRDLYGMSYQEAAYRKNRALKHWARTGMVNDPGFDKVVLYTPDQIAEAILLDETVSAMKATQVEVQDTLGGFSVPEDFRLMVIERLPGMTVVRSRANVMPTSRDVLSMLKRTGGNGRYIGAARVSWVDETPPSAAISQTNATYGMVRIPVHVSMANVPMSRSLLEDAAIDPLAYVQAELGPAMALDEDEKFLTGDGNGVPQGILNGVLANGAPFDGDITQVASGGTTTITADAVVNMPMRLEAQYRNEPGCGWFATKETYSAIYQLKDNQNRYLWASNIDQLSQGYPTSLRGYPIAETQALPQIAANTYPLVFGNLKRAYTIADRVGMSFERYQDSNTVDKDTVIFYARRRVGGQVTGGWALVAMKVATSL